MPRQLISSGSPFEAQVGYSRAVVQGDWCFVAGTTGSDPATKVMPDGVADQAANALKVIGAALEQGGFSFADVVRATYYITDPAYWDQIGPPLGAVFGDIRPAATCVVAGLIKPEMKIEIEVTAFKDRSHDHHDGIKNCDTVKKARNWLDNSRVPYSFHDYKVSGVDEAALRGWVAEHGWETLLNRSGTTFRALPEGDRAHIDADKAILLMLTNPSMIKRPILNTGKGTIVGFKATTYEDALQGVAA